MAKYPDELRADLQQYYGIDLDHAIAGEHTAEHVEEQWVDAEPVERGAPAVAAFDVDAPYKQGEQRGGHTAGGEHKRGRPYILVDGQAVGE